MTILKRNSVAKRMESSKRLKWNSATPLTSGNNGDDQLSGRASSTAQSTTKASSREVIVPHSEITSVSTRLHHVTYKLESQENSKHCARNRKWWGCRLIGTIADHRMTNNNRIPGTRCRKQWNEINGWLFAVIFICLTLGNCLVQVAAVSGQPNSEQTRSSSKSYTRTVRNEPVAKAFSPSTTSRSTASFLPSDAIINSKPTASTAAPGVSRYKNRNISFSSNTNYHNSSRIGYTNSYSSNNNANLYRSSSSLAERRSSASSSRRRRKNKEMQTTTMTSIDRPFYTKITSSDAVSKPPHYYRRDRLTGKKASKKGKYSSSSSSSSEKYSKTKSKSKHKHGKKERHPYEYGGEYEDIPEGDDEYPLMPHTTEKSYHPHKLSLEPFFNFLTSLATASREVIMSKEQQHNGHQPTPATTVSPLDDGNKYSEEEEEDDAINHSMREGAKKSKNSKKGKKGKKGSKERHKSSEESSGEVDAEYDPQKDEVSEGPIPIPIPNKLVGSPEVEETNDDDAAETAINPMENPGVLHILDVLRTPMLPDYDSPPVASSPPTPTAERLQGVSSLITDSGNKKNEEEGRPPSGRANIILNKGQGHGAYSNAQGSENTSGGEKREEKQLLRASERDPMDSFHDQSATDLQAQESMSHAQMVPPPNTFSSSDALQNPHQQQQQQQKSNDLAMAASSPQEGKPAASETDIFGKPHQHGKDDFVSKYPNSFVYHQPSGAMPPGSRLYISPSPSGAPPNPMFGPPSSRPPFRMNRLRPNLHSYYDPSYHHYAGAGESKVPSEMIGIRHPYGPPHFTAPPHHRILPSPGPPPPRFGNGYGNRPGFMNMMMPHRGSHYVGQTLASAPKPFGSGQSQTGSSNNNYHQDLAGNGNANSNGDSTLKQGDTTGADVTGSSSDNLEQYGSSSNDNSIASENSETKKIGIMESFDLFYKEYKIMTWVAVFFVTSLALLTLLVYMYINNPPTEVVQARQLFPWNDLLNNPQIKKFLSSLQFSTKRSDGKPTTEEYLKPFGKGFGSKSGRQKRKHTRSKQDKEKQLKMIRRRMILATRNSSTRIPFKFTTSSNISSRKSSPGSPVAASSVTKQ